MWKLAALASLALCAAQTPAAPDATTGKAAPNVTVTEARAPRPNQSAHTSSSGTPARTVCWQLTSVCTRADED